MKVAKGFFLGVGAVFAAVAVLVGYLYISSQSALPKAQASIETFLTAFTEAWDFEDVASQMTERNLADMRRLQRSGALIQIAKLGRYQKSEGASLVHYSTSASGTVSVVELLGHFESGRARLQIAVEERGGTQRIAGFKLLLDGPIMARTTRS
ncbi:MAG: hypothetical protein JSS20_06780 [Proteobacteria bacterium]|nr:hypothetical protein [Pseudomonadota bacterium]